MLDSPMMFTEGQKNTRRKSFQAVLPQDIILINLFIAHPFKALKKQGFLNRGSSEGRDRFKRQ